MKYSAVQMIWFMYEFSSSMNHIKSKYDGKNTFSLGKLAKKKSDKMTGKQMMCNSKKRAYN